MIYFSKENKSISKMGFNQQNNHYQLVSAKNPRKKNFSIFNLYIHKYLFNQIINF